jgi:pilus assembly protein Flp/PilA
MNMVQRIVNVLKHLNRSEAQDIVEYALVVAMLAFSIVASEQTLATNIRGSFTKMGAALTSSIT